LELQQAPAGGGRVLAFNHVQYPVEGNARKHAIGKGDEDDEDAPYCKELLEKKKKERRKPSERVQNVRW
jgi:hypothetical protein